jgi:hypothetical protein
MIDPIKNRIEDLVKLSKAHDESLSPEMKEILTDAAKLIMVDLIDLTHPRYEAELAVFPGGKH